MNTDGYVLESVREDRGFLELRRGWNDLLDHSYSDTPFLTWEWNYAWWKTYSAGKELRIITVRSEHGELLGIAPLFMKTSRFYGMPVRALTNIAELLSDRVDFIVREGSPEIYRMLIDEVKAVPDWDILVLEQVPGNSPILTHNDHANIEVSTHLPYIKIEGDWETFYSKLSKKLRRDLHNKQNLLTKSGEWEYVHGKGLENIEEVLSIERESDKKGIGIDFFKTPKEKDFLVEFMRLSSGKDLVNIALLHHATGYIGDIVGFVYKETYMAYHTAFKSRYYRFSPGKLLFLETIRKSFQRGLKEYDFLRGDSYTKDLWTGEHRTNFRYVLFNRKLKLRALQWMVFRARPKIKGLFGRRHGDHPVEQEH